MFFASDNGAACPPQIMAALAQANRDGAMPYGNDNVTAKAVALVRKVLEAPQAEVFFVTTGTAANALALATLSPPWGAILCHEGAHVEHDECGAPEFFSGSKLVRVQGDHGRLTPEALIEVLDGFTPGNVHSVQPTALTVTNVTEAGTTYRPEEIAALASVARLRGLSVHLDGARFANALAATGASPAEMTWRAGVDALSFGGTKNGMMGAEAVVFFTPDKAWEFQLRRKRAGHLMSKNRYLAAQFLGGLENNAWLDWARHANAMAARLAKGIGPARLAHPVEANIVFADLPEPARARARTAGAMFYEMGGDRVRLVTSWATTEAEVDSFLAHLNP
jgi:threonine aldolase